MKPNKYPFFQIEKKIEKKIAYLYLNRPEKRNFMNWDFWNDLPNVIEDLENDDSIRVVILAAKGKSFSLGLDIVQFAEQFSDTLHGENADNRETLYELILKMQSGFNKIHQGKKIYIAAVQKHCIGGGLDLISACDIRIASQDASFSLREAAVAIVADMGSLNRLPNIIGQGNTRLMALTGHDYTAQQALQMGLISEIYSNYDDLLQGAEKLAVTIANNPNLAVKGTKEILNYMENHSVEDGLKYVAAWNAAFLDSKNFREMVKSFQEKRKPNYS